MEKSQLETIDMICQNIQFMGTALQEYVRKTNDLYKLIEILFFCLHKHEFCQFRSCLIYLPGKIDEKCDSDMKHTVDMSFIQASYPKLTM